MNRLLLLYDRLRGRDRLARSRLFDVIMATAPTSYWIEMGGNPDELRRRLSR